MKPAQVSSADSGTIVDFLNYIFGLFGFTADYSILQNIVRKCAHFAEFFIHSLLLCGCFSGSIKDKFKYVLLSGLLTACTDEFLQLFFEGRGCQLRDVFIDLSGTLAGAGFSGIISIIRRRFR